jgi:hypothetical protein
MTTIRETSMSWWNCLSPDERSVMVQKYHKNILMGKDRHHSTLTGREVEIIFRNENYDYIS